MEQIKITSLELENVKRIKAVKLEPTQNGLTILGGKNRQGKTSVLDSIAWVLGGDKYKPSKPQREGSMIDPSLKLVLSNGIIVERKGKNSSLKVTDPNGVKAGQNLLNSFIDELALNLPKFMNSNAKEKANTLLQIIGVGPQLNELETEHKKTYQLRLTTGQMRDQKKKYAEELTFYAEAPKDLVSVSELIEQQQTILAINGENQRKRQNAQQIAARLQMEQQKLNDLLNAVEKQKQIVSELEKDVQIANTSLIGLLDQSTAELEENIRNVEAINIKVRANFEKEKAMEEAKELDNKYKEYTEELSKINKKKYELLNNANLPLPGLSIEDDELTYNDQKWDNMSDAEKLIVATSIVRKLKPECGFVLLDKLEAMDIDTLQDFGKWLEAEGLQVIATRVSTGEECSIIIEDGYVKGEEMQQEELKDNSEIINIPF